MTNKCYNAPQCTNETEVEFCNECLMNGGIKQTKLSKQDLVNIFKVARKEELSFVVVGIEAEGTKEAIVVPVESFDAKEQFYLNAHSDDLVHVMNSKVRIFNVIATSTDGISYIFNSGMRRDETFE